MSQRNVEKVIGKLATDEQFRRRFVAAPDAALQHLVDEGVDLNDCERRALVGLDSGSLERFAETLDPGIQKVELKGGCS